MYAPSARISENEKGELTMSAAGARKIEKAFLGSETVHESYPQDGTSLDIVRFTQVGRALPHARGKCETLRH